MITKSKSGMRFADGCRSAYIIRDSISWGRTMIRVTCACGKRLKAADECAGKLAKCPQCGQIVLVKEVPVDAIVIEPIDAIVVQPVHFRSRLACIAVGILVVFALVFGGAHAWLSRSSVLSESPKRHRTRAQMPRVQIEPVTEYSELGEYTVRGQTKRDFLVTTGSKPQALVQLAKKLHAAHPSDTLHFFDDDAYYKEYVESDKNYGSSRHDETAYPEEWVESHMVGAVNWMIGDGWSFWGGPYETMHARLE